MQVRYSRAVKGKVFISSPTFWNLLDSQGECLCVLLFLSLGLGEGLGSMMMLGWK
jgi:hypothetical protein